MRADQTPVKAGPASQSTDQDPSKTKPGQPRKYAIRTPGAALDMVFDYRQRPGTAAHSGSAALDEPS